MSAAAEIEGGHYPAVPPGAILPMTLMSKDEHMELELQRPSPMKEAFHPSGSAAVAAQGTLPEACPPRAAS